MYSANLLAITKIQGLAVSYTIFQPPPTLELFGWCLRRSLLTVTAIIAAIAIAVSTLRMFGI
jgi:hypothetical protein